MTEISKQTEFNCLTVFLLESVQLLLVWEVKQESKVQDLFGWRFCFEPNSYIRYKQEFYFWLIQNTNS